MKGEQGGEIMKQHLDRRTSEVLLAFVIIARATGYLFSKIGMSGLGIFNLLALRFLIAAGLLGLVFAPRLRRIDRRSFRAGLIMGGLYFLVMTAELSGLKRTASSTVSFLENTSIVLVPLLGAAAYRRAPGAKAVLCAGIALAGVGFLTLGCGVRFGMGELFSLLAATLYACAILTTDRLTHRGGIDTLTAGIVQVATIGVLSLCASCITETPRLPQTGMEWVSVLALAAVCSVFGVTLQPVAQAGTTADRAGMFCALNPLVASVLGVVFLHEHLAPQGLIGAALILAGILLSYAKLPARSGCRHRKQLT